MTVDEGSFTHKSEPEPQESDGLTEDGELTNQPERGLVSTNAEDDVSQLSILDIFNLRYKRTAGKAIKLYKFTLAYWLARVPSIPPCSPYNEGSGPCPYYRDPKGCLFYRAYVRAQLERNYIAWMACGVFAEAVLHQRNLIEEEHPGLSLYESTNIAAQIVLLGKDITKGNVSRNVAAMNLLLAKLPAKNGSNNNGDGSNGKKDRRRKGPVKETSDRARIARLLGPDALDEVNDPGSASADLYPEYTTKEPQEMDPVD